MHRNALQPGHSLHWYLIENILGQGGFGITYLAHDLNLDQHVAIKEYLPIELAVREGDHTVLPVSEAHDDRFRWGLDRFIKEARTLAQFKHPNIVRVLSVFEENNTAYMVMDYESGQCFQDVLGQPGKLDEIELIKILFPILGGLKQVHEAGFIHRDIKPANIFLRDDESPVLLDFGSARQALGQETKTLTSIVSPGYAPYEQYYSKGDKQGPWTDIYGLGATMYRAITGRPPMDAIDRSESILKTSHDNFVSVSEIGAGKFSSRFLLAIDHAIKFDPDDRPKSIQEWMDEFDIPDEALTTSVRFEEKNTELRPDTNTTVVADLPASGSNDRSEPQEKKRSYRLALSALLLLVMAIAAGTYHFQSALGPDTSDQPLTTVETPAKPDQSEPDIVMTEPAPKETPSEPVIAETDNELSELEKNLQSGHEAFKAGRLTSPFSNSALFYYQSALELDSSNNSAQTGINEIRNQLFKKAQSAQSTNDFFSAQDLLIQALALFPEDPELKSAYDDLLNTIQQTENQKKIIGLLGQAREAQKENRLTQPTGRNAVIYFQQVLAMDSSNPEAQAGLDSISNQLLDDTQQAISYADLNKADSILDQIRTISGTTNDILRLRKTITEKRESIVAESKQNREISNLLSIAQSHLTAMRLSSPAGDNALDSYQAILALDPENVSAHEGLKTIVDEYIKLTDRAINNNKLDRAAHFLAIAQDILPDAETVKLRASEISSARKLALEQKQKRQAKQEEEKRRQQALEKQQKIEKQRLTQQENERKRQEQEAHRLLEKQREIDKKEREKQLAEANKKRMVISVTGVDDKKFKHVRLTKNGLIEHTTQQLSSNGWEVITVQEAASKPNALMLNIRLSYNLNTSVGFYSYAISVNILERTKVPVANALFSPTAIWSKGDSGIAQVHELQKINDIVKKQVNSFLQLN